VVNGWVALPVLVVTLLVFRWGTSNIKHRTPNTERRTSNKAQERV
jgi:hypothetical protein